MRIMFLASSEFALPTLRNLASSGHEIVEVITQPAKQAGRGKRVKRMPVHVLAHELGLTVREVEDVNDPSFIEHTRSLSIDLGVVIAFGQFLRDGFLDAIKFGCFNLHASLLPKYRGAAPINWAIVNGEAKSGVTVFKIVRSMDAGPILTTRWTYIKPEETAAELHDRLAGVGVDAVQAALELYADGTEPEGESQDHSLATKAPKLKKADGRIDFDRPAEQVANHIHGMTTWPGASTVYYADDGRWEQVNILRARKAETPNRPQDEPGTIDERLYVACAGSFLEILEIKPSSGRVMSWPDYVNGRHVQAGDYFADKE